MNVLELMKTRCSVRKFEDRAVEEDTIRAVLEAARIAPSACNNQPRHFVVVTDQDLKAAISERWSAAPVIIVAVGNKSEAWTRKDGKNHCDIDVAIAVDHMTLRAAELGLGTCWVCAFDAAGCAKTLSLPEGYEAIALLPLGYPVELADPNRHATDRKPLEQIVSWNRLSLDD